MKRPEAKCPECGEKIFHLIQVRSEVADYKMFLGRNGEVEISSKRNPRDDGEVIHYECPVCEEVVCYNFAEAEKILRGETK